MKLTGWKLLVALWVFMGASSFILSPIAKAADAAPGEGAYLGAFVGMGSGVISPKVQVFDLNTTQFTDATFEATNGGFGLSGVEGGGWFGYGIKTADDLYIGLDGSFAASDNKIELQSSVDLTDGETSGAISTASAERNWVGTGALRVGYYVNPSTLFSLSGGVSVSQYDVTIGGDTATVYAGGPQVGASLTTNLTKVDPNLSLRMDALYTDYLTGEINGINGVNVNGAGNAGKNNNSELTGNETTFRVGLTYQIW